MAKPTQNKNLPAGAISAPDFRWFIAHTPKAWLKAAKIERPVYFSVGMALAQFGDYATGKRVNPSVRTIHRMTGVNEKTVSKVLNYLVGIGALAKVGTNQGSHGGKPYPVYELRRERGSNVDLVLNSVDAGTLQLGEFEEVAVGTTEVLPEGDAVGAVGTTGEAVGTTGEAVGTTGEAVGTTEDNKNVQNVKNYSLAEAHSSAPFVALPLQGRDEEREQGDVIDFDSEWTRYLASSSGDEFARLFS
jgi:hypothetical protein